MPSNLLPYLLPVKDSKGLYNIDLCFLEEIQQLPPKITFVTQDKESIATLDKLGISGSELVKQSFENLSKIKLESHEAEKNEKGVLIYNKEFASEKILDKAFTKEVADSLDTKKILVSIPVRDSILICDGMDKAAEENLTLESQKLYNDFGKEAISSLVFILEDGVITSARSPKSSLDKLENLKSNSGSYTAKVTKTKLFQELYNFRIMVEAQKIEDLQNGLLFTILELIKDCYSDSNFNNTIEIITTTDSIDKSREQVQKVRNLFDRVSEKYNSLYSKRNEPIKLSFFFSKDFVKGNNHKKIIKYLN